MQDGGGGALRGAAAPAGSGPSGLRDERPRESGATGGNQQRRARGRRGGPGRRAARGQDGGGRPRGRAPGGAERAQRGGWQDGPARGVRGARTGPAWAGIAVGGQTPSFLCVLGVFAAVEGAGGSVRKNLSPPAYERTEQLGIE